MKQYIKLILVSRSPRRKEILKKLNFKFEVLKPAINNEIIFKDPAQTTLNNAKRKVMSVLSIAPDNSILIGIDTLVYLDNEILGKPKNKENAIKMLKKLSGNWHRVYSGLYIYDKRCKRSVEGVAITDVKFKPLTDSEIYWYINTNEPYDKAGAYGIQGYASMFIEKIRGCYYNVVGFPINLLYKLLVKLGYDPLTFIEISR